MSVNWFNDRPLHLETVCVCLREAVEERENFFRFDPEKTATANPLDLPQRPYDQGSGLKPFAVSLANRIKILSRYAFAPDKLNKFSSFNSPPGRGGHELSLPNEGVFTELLTSLEIPPENFRNPAPFRWTDMKFFHACAELLNRYILYPQPTPFNSGLNQVFGWDFDMEFSDLQNGNKLTGNWQNDGPLPNRSSSGTYRMLNGSVPAEWIKDDLKIRQSDYRFYYDSSLLSGAESTPLTGEFRFRLTANWKLNCDGETVAAAADTMEYTLTDGGSVMLHIPEEWQMHIAQTLSGSNCSSKSSAGLLLNTPEIKLSTENFPALPYKYLN